MLLSSCWPRRRSAVVVQVLLRHPGVKDLYEYEDGHIMDVAAVNGHLPMVKFLAEERMPIAPSAMAHAAHYNHTEIMKARKCSVAFFSACASVGGEYRCLRLSDDSLTRCAMQVLLMKPMDIKTTMQAIAGGASPDMARIIVDAMHMSESSRGVHERF